jgi:glutamyl/glutaminyl-tRNA synthetase
VVKKSFAACEAALKKTAKALGVKAGVLVHPTRLAVTGNTAGPSSVSFARSARQRKIVGKD